MHLHLHLCWMLENMSSSEQAKTFPDYSLSRTGGHAPQQRRTVQQNILTEQKSDQNVTCKGCSSRSQCTVHPVENKEHLWISISLHIAPIKNKNKNNPVVFHMDISTIDKCQLPQTDYST